MRFAGGAGAAPRAPNQSKHIKPGTCLVMGWFPWPNFFSRVVSSSVVSIWQRAGSANAESVTGLRKLPPPCCYASACAGHRTQQRSTRSGGIGAARASLRGARVLRLVEACLGMCIDMDKSMHACLCARSTTAELPKHKHGPRHGGTGPRRASSPEAGGWAVGARVSTLGMPSMARTSSSNRHFFLARPAIPPRSLRAAPRGLSSQTRFSDGVHKQAKPGS